MLRDVARRAARLLAVALAVVLLTTACASSGSGVASDGGSSAEVLVGADSFCVLWTELKTHMYDPDGLDQEGLTAYLDAREAAAAQLPDELAEEWESILAWDDPMTEMLYAIGFEMEALNEEMVSAAFGSVDAAERAESAHETAVGQIDRWVVRSCGEGTDTLTFCGVWTEIILTLEGNAQDPNADPESDDARNRFADLVAQADAVAPAEIRGDWDPIADYYLTWHDLLVTVNFDENLISDELLSDAFGSPETAAAAAAEAESSVSVVESWAATGCGDFCTRSSELLQAIGELGEPLDARVADAYSFATRTRSLAHADVVMPDELRIYWDPVFAELTDWMGWWERHDYDRQQLDTPEAQAEAIEIYRQAEYQAILEGGDPERDAQLRAAIDAWRAGEVELTGDLAEMVARMATAPLWDRQGFGSAVYEIDQWVQRTCRSNSGGPGVVEVRFGGVTGAAGDQLAVVMGPVGSTVEDLATPEQFSLGIACAALDRDPWGVSLGEEEDEHGQPALQYWGDRLRSRSPEAEAGSPCDWHGDSPRVEPGDYTIVAARYDGATPRNSVDALPTHCLAFDVSISGDTFIEIPELPECEFAKQPPEPGEWGYTEPVSASTSGAGTLKVRIPTQVIPAAAEADDRSGYRLQFIALPNGTMLNDVGRAQVFPSAAGCVWLWDERYFPDELEMRPVEVPLGSLPSQGLRSCLDPDWLNGAAPIPGAQAGEPAEDSSLPLTVLAPGVYDVYVRSYWESWAHEGFCTQFEATVDGDTVVDLPVALPELEPCE